MQKEVKTPSKTQSSSGIRASRCWWRHVVRHAPETDPGPLPTLFNYGNKSPRPWRRACFLVWRNGHQVALLGHTSKKQGWDIGLREDTDSLWPLDPRAFAATLHPLDQPWRSEQPEESSPDAESGASAWRDWLTLQRLGCETHQFIVFSPNRDHPIAFGCLLLK